MAATLTQELARELVKSGVITGLHRGAVIGRSRTFPLDYTEQEEMNVWVDKAVENLLRNIRPDLFVDGVAEGVPLAELSGMKPLDTAMGTTFGDKGRKDKGRKEGDDKRP